MSCATIVKPRSSCYYRPLHSLVTARERVAAATAAAILSVRCQYLLNVTGWIFWVWIAIQPTVSVKPRCNRECVTCRLWMHAKRPHSSQSKSHLFRPAICDLIPAPNSQPQTHLSSTSIFRPRNINRYRLTFSNHRLRLHFHNRRLFFIHFLSTCQKKL